ncbi:hypothetical protein [Paraflavitalea sp. CAU 1676]|uniref:hypothetical protein n=1 Tax=Paraflavitalea sp. CAU 1676 TaxID=3032598 RepID=UPI0023DAE793|nr:hypothetical protein [Paraflavitalea sp. CAU 1676]MDF2189038.1 hypothetical protein [Paraflavitalea sp. CAU 1676]
MSLYTKKKDASRLVIGMYAMDSSTHSIPKYTMPDDAQDMRTIYHLVHDELMLDGNSRMNLATFCQTWLDEYVH